MRLENKYTVIDDLIIQYLPEEEKSPMPLALQAWIEESPENRAYYLSRREIWFSSLSGKENERFNEDDAYKRFQAHTGQTNQKPAKNISWRYTLSRVAASVALLIAVGAVCWRMGGNQVKDQLADVIIEAPMGSRTRLYLPDSTLVWLNAGSRLQYSQSFGVDTRTVQLTGEAYFEVTRKEKYPFIVETDELHLKVLGTRFNFRNYREDEQAVVDLLEGRVSLMNPLLPGEECFLVPDQKVVMDKKSGHMNVLTVTTRHATGWTEGFLHFNEELLPDIVNELERIYDVRIRIADESLKTFRFYGQFVQKETTLVDLLDMLAATEKLDYHIQNKEIILTAK